MLARYVTTSLLALFIAAPPAVSTSRSAHDSVREELLELRRQAAAIHGASPTRARLYLAIAELERSEEHLEKAREALKLAERFGAAPLQVQGQLAACTMAEGDLEESEHLFTEIVRAQPDELRWRRKRAEVRLLAKRFLAAACDLADVREDSPSSFSQEDELRLANSLVMAGHVQAGVSSLDRALHGGRESAMLVQRAIELETELGAFGAALARTEKLMALGASSHTVAGLRGDLYVSLGQPDRARTEWQSAATGLRRTLRKRRGSRALRRQLALLENKLAGLASTTLTHMPQ